MNKEINITTAKKKEKKSEKQEKKGKNEKNTVRGEQKQKYL